MATAPILRHQVNLGFGVGVAVLVIMGAAAVWSSTRSQHAALERKGIFERRSAIDQLLSTVQDAETGQRGFLLLGDTTLLGRYEAAVASLPNHLRAFRAAVSSFSDRAARLDSLDVLVRNKLGELAQTIELHRAGRANEALQVVRAGSGRRSTEAIRAVLAALMEEENRLLDFWDGRLRAADRISLYTSTAGAILGVLFLVFGAMSLRRNIARREGAEAALKESQQTLTRLLEALPVAVFVLDANGKPFFANRASHAILGRGIDPATPTSELAEIYQVYIAGTDQMYPPERLPVVRALAGESVYIEDIEVRRPDRVLPIEVWAAPILDSAGRVLFAVAVFSDISERVEARAAIRDLNEQLHRRVTDLTEMTQELDAFSYSVSHDLRTPVRHISGFARLLAETSGPDLGEQGAHYLARIVDASRHMGELIDDLLNLARVSRLEMVLQPCDLNALLRSVVYDLREDIRGRDIDWRIEKLPAVQADSRLLRHVLVNLLANALKFSRTRPRAVIAIGHVASNGIPAIYVRDNGVGFDMRYADKLFGVFQRLHLPEQFEGTGVGLATAQRIVKKHGGRMWAEAELDKGATFYFTLKAATEGAVVKGES